MKKLLATIMMAAITASPVMAGDGNIRVNQVGYLPDQEKIIVVDNVAPRKIKVKNKVGKVVAKPKVLRTAQSPFTQKMRYIIDVSDINTPGRYIIDVDGMTMPFTVERKAYHPLALSAVKSFYLMRSGVEILPQYAGMYARPLGHPDTLVMIHPAAANGSRPALTKISSPLGWYDAGDYNKYIVNSAFTIGQMLAVYQQIPQYFENFNLNIPESGNSTPDILDEIMFNIKWMLTMQDPSDGGVYHKLTTPNFEGFVMPKDCHQKRYVVQKSVTASYDFAAVMAQAARIYAKYTDYTGFAENALAAAETAYLWAKNNPTAFYRQNDMNQKHEPKVFTGEYGDGNAMDESFWAATELYLATGKQQYLEDAKRNMPESFEAPVWGQVSGLGIYAWLDAKDSGMSGKCQKMLDEYAAKMNDNVANSSFQTPAGDQANDFGWGCLAEKFCSPAIALMFADKYGKNASYRTNALRLADYILGRNALGYCFVTGWGSKSPMHPHQRISSADGIVPPMPGLLVGGPNPGQQDKASNIDYPSNAPDESYADVEASYASNEIAINWNACLVGMICWIDALM